MRRCTFVGFNENNFAGILSTLFCERCHGGVAKIDDYSAILAISGTTPGSVETERYFKPSPRSNLHQNNLFSS
jgi:hypothetical protein